MMDDIIYLEAQDILKAHRLGMEQFGGMLGHPDEACVEKRIVEPQQVVFGLETHPSFSQKAASYLYRLIISHCFTDGNKRVAVLSTELFLNLNGYEFLASEDQLYEMCLKIGNHKTRPSEIAVARWINSNITKLDY